MAKWEPDLVAGDVLSLKKSNVQEWIWLDAEDWRGLREGTEEYATRTSKPATGGLAETWRKSLMGVALGRRECELRNNLKFYIV